ncbi:hypothetical protein IKE07_01770 [Candidatus Saccharibacteria bacterium]|nr:hypothetical protein [Candidatus Saccharibacteria bacterium]
MQECFDTFEYDFRDLGPDHFIWLPLKNVPIVEWYPINSLEQPALSCFNLACWNAIAKFATDNQQFLGKLAEQYKEMGYFLFHYESKFGIIGVDEYNNGRKPGRATIFNGRKTKQFEDDRKLKTTHLRLVLSSVEYPWKEVAYEKGDIAYYQNIHISDDSYSCWDD